MEIRSACAEDARRLLEIYGWYVENTAITYECTVPTEAEFKARVEDTLKKYPYLVIEDGKNIIGYAYAGPLKTREAYRLSCELSIYLDRKLRGRGYGRALYEELEKRLGGMGITNLYACIASPPVEDEYLTNASEHFHGRMGFERVGEFHRCARKFGRIYNMIWMEKLLEAKKS